MPCQKCNGYWECAVDGGELCGGHHETWKELGQIREFGHVFKVFVTDAHQRGEVVVKIEHVPEDASSQT